MLMKDVINCCRNISYGKVYNKFAWKSNLNRTSVLLWYRITAHGRET